MLDWVPGAYHGDLVRHLLGLDGGVVSGFAVGVVEFVITKLVGVGWASLAPVVFIPIVFFAVATLSSERSPAALAAGVNVVNPLIFDRFYVGQLGVLLLGYAVQPLALQAIHDSRRNRLRSASIVALWFIQRVSFSVHFIWIVGLY